MLSTPTMRVPAPVFAHLLGGRPTLPDREIVRVDAEGFRVGGDVFSENAQRFVLEALLTRKLGLAPALVMGTFAGDARIEALALRDVADPLGTERAEWTLMVTYSVVVQAGADELPPETASYTRLLWAPADLVGLALTSKDALIIDDTLDPFEVCIDGLCVQSAVFVLNERVGS